MKFYTRISEVCVYGVGCVVSWMVFDFWRLFGMCVIPGFDYVHGVIMVVVRY